MGEESRMADVAISVLGLVPKVGHRSCWGHYLGVATLVDGIGVQPVLFPSFMAGTLATLADAVATWGCSSAGRAPRSQ